MGQQSRQSRAAALACAVAAAAVVSTAGASAPNPGPIQPPTSLPASPCLVVLDDLGNVGLRITDAQSLAQIVIAGLRQRVGIDRASYGGQAAAARSMKRMLAGTGSPTTLQDQQIAEFEACERAARWRVAARFGVKARRHWITLSCRSTGPGGRELDQERFEGATFAEARDKAERALSTFCLQIAPPGPAPGAPAR